MQLKRKREGGGSCGRAKTAELWLLNWVNLSPGMGIESLRESYRGKKNNWKACATHVIADMANAT